MVKNRHIEKIVTVLMVLAVLLTFFSDKFVSSATAKGVSLEYETKLFDTDKVMEVNIIIDESKWQDMLDNAISEEYVQCDTEINGKTFYRVAIRPKGNTSLSNIAMDTTTDRYSFKLEFDKYVDGQTCWGLDKLILNNNYADATNMKEALVYDMYKYIGANASLYNFAKVSVNGEYWGVYLALEAVEESFMLRNFGTEDGELYKPENMNMGGMQMPDMNNGEMPDFGNMQMPDMNNGEMPDFGNMQMPDMNNGEMPDFGNMQMPDMNNGEMPDFGNMQMPDMNNGEMPDFNGKGMGGMNGGGSDLNYTDSELDSYSTIWESAITNTTDADHERVVTALKNISEGNDLEKYMDIDNLLKYMAVHVFSVNEDSLSGSMAHNYYLYEHDGRLNILPWDYNLILGGMGMHGNGDASSTINDPIDTPFSATNFFDTLLENEEYLAKYHEYLQMLTEKYINGGGFDEFYERTRQQIDELVSSDPTAFYSNDEYISAVAMLYDTVNLRSDSIQGQLDGSIPSTDSGQRENSGSLIDTSAIDLSVMGTMNNGGGGQMPDGMQQPQGDGQMPDGMQQPQGDGQMPDGMQPPQGDGQMPDGMQPSQGDEQMPDGMQPPQGDGQMPDGMQQPPQGNGQTPDDTQTSQGEDQQASENTQDTTNEGTVSQTNDFGQFDGKNKPDRNNMGEHGGSPNNMPNNSQNSNVKTNLIMTGISFGILIIALIIAKLYRKKNIRK